LLRKLRAERGLRQEDLARLLGRSQSYVSKYEMGEIQLGFLEVRRICQVIGISFEGFVRRFERQAR
jgi:transcriptional regulator with XRE-family HTH domain